jgi:hypothetical protein
MLALAVPTLVRKAGLCTAVQKQTLSFRALIRKFTFPLGSLAHGGGQLIGGHVLGDYCIKRIAVMYKPYETKPFATQSLGKAIPQLAATISGVHRISLLSNS